MYVDTQFIRVIGTNGVQISVPINCVECTAYTREITSSACMQVRTKLNFGV